MGWLVKLTCARAREGKSARFVLYGRARAAAHSGRGVKKSWQGGASRPANLKKSWHKSNSLFS